MSTLNGYAMVEKVIHEVCACYGLNRRQLLANGRLPRIAWARQIAMSLAYEESDLSQQEVGRVFHRTKGTVSYAWACVRERIEAYGKTDGARVNQLREMIRKKPSE